MRANWYPQGLIKPGGDPVYTGGMAISAHNLAGPSKQQVRAPWLAIAEFILDGLSCIGTAGQLFHLSLVQNYMEAP